MLVIIKGNVYLIGLVDIRGRGRGS
jgi:hypothetical protein